MPQSYRVLSESIEEVDDVSETDAHKAALTVVQSMEGESPEAIREVLDALGILEPLQKHRTK